MPGALLCRNLYAQLALHFGDDAKLSLDVYPTDEVAGRFARVALIRLSQSLPEYRDRLCFFAWILEERSGRQRVLQDDHLVVIAGESFRFPHGR
jgi:hypothetical protein